MAFCTTAFPTIIIVDILFQCIDQFFSFAFQSIKNVIKDYKVRKPSVRATELPPCNGGEVMKITSRIYRGFIHIQAQ